jgi:aminoglycoside phosphotransferase family enzyme
MDGVGQFNQYNRFTRQEMRMPHHLEAIIQWMQRPGFYPYSVDSVSLQQTHISLVLLAGPRVYKIKKPVDLGFLDFRTLEKGFCCGDVACDLAFLCMDLEYQGYAAATASLVAGYVRHSGDAAAYGLLP